MSSTLGKGEVKVFKEGEKKPTKSPAESSSTYFATCTALSEIFFLKLFFLYTVLSMGPAPKGFFHSYTLREVIYVVTMKYTMPCYSQEEKK